MDSSFFKIWNMEKLAYNTFLSKFSCNHFLGRVLGEGTGKLSSNSAIWLKPYLRARSLGVSPSTDRGCRGAPSSNRVNKQSPLPLKAAVCRATQPVKEERSCRSAFPCLTSIEHVDGCPPMQAACKRRSRQTTFELQHSLG